MRVPSDCRSTSPNCYCIFRHIAVQVSPPFGPRQFATYANLRKYASRPAAPHGAAPLSRRRLALAPRQPSTLWLCPGRQPVRLSTVNSLGLVRYTVSIYQPRSQLRCWYKKEKRNTTHWTKTRVLILARQIKQFLKRCAVLPDLAA